MTRFSGRRTVALTALFLASACGSDGGGTGTDGGTGVAPPPAAAPVPTPTPTPSPTYRTAFDFSRDQSFESQVAEARVVRRYNASAPTFYAFESAQAAIRNDLRAVRVSFVAATRSASIVTTTETTSFGSQALTHDSADLLRYARIEPELSTSFLLARPASAFRYLASGSQTIQSSGFPDGGARATTETERYFLAGIPTEVPDVPASGIQRYAATLITSAVVFDGGSGLNAGGTLSFDFGTRQLSGSFNAVQGAWTTGTTPVHATLMFAGSESNGYVSGRITSPDSGYAGEFTGRLFGPAGAELGLLFTITRDGKGSAGQITAIKG